MRQPELHDGFGQQVEGRKEADAQAGNVFGIARMLHAVGKQNGILVKRLSGIAALAASHHTVLAVPEPAIAHTRGQLRPRLERMPVVFG
ncbi:MAG: hypothetical protein SH868_06310 [Bythopirellula sp.]|nr:hypothetical protein [Bythopirellula sp.]